MATGLKDVQAPNPNFDNFDRTGWTCTELHNHFHY
jgi:hypothetical protein